MDNKPKIKRANKTHFCEICGHNIEKGQMYKHDMFYVSRSYDNEFDSYSGGYMKTWRVHEHKFACDLAIEKTKSEQHQFI